MNTEHLRQTDAPLLMAIGIVILAGWGPGPARLSAQTGPFALNGPDTPPGCVTVTNGLLGRWKGDDSALDSARTNHGIPFGGVAFAPGMVNAAFSLDGTNDYVRIAAPSSLSLTGFSITIHAWIKPSVLDPNRTHTLVSKANLRDSHAWWHLSIVRDRLRFYVSRNGIDSGAKVGETLPGLVPAGVWSHVAATYDRSSRALRLFVNGTEAPVTLLIDSVVINLPESTEPIRIGALAGSAGVAANFFAGLVDEVAIFDRALAIHEVQAVAMAGATGGCIDPPMLLGPDPLSSGQVGGGYSALFRGERGMPPYRFELAAGSLPAGLTLTTNGLLSGLALAEGMSTFDVSMTDAWGQSGPGARRPCSITITSPPPACRSSPSGLIGWWSGDGHRADFGGTNHGTLINGAGYAPGVTGPAFSFDGVNDYVQIGSTTPTLQLTNQVSMMAWIHPTGVGNPTNGGAILIRDGNYGLLYRPNRRLYVAIASTTPGWGGSVESPEIPYLQWTHVAAVYDGTAVRTYFNGALVNAWHASGPIGDFYPAFNEFRIGGRQAFAQPFQGRIDEAALFDRALSGAEILSVYQAGVAGLCRPAVPCQVPGTPAPPGGPYPVTAHPTALTLPRADEYRPYTNHVGAAFCGQPVSYTLAGGALPEGLRLETNGWLVGAAGERGAYGFTVDAMDAAGNSAVGSVLLIVQPATPWFSRWPEGGSVRLGETLWLAAQTRGPSTFQWFFNDAPLPDATNTDLSIAQMSVAQAGRYRVRAANDVGASESPEALVQVTGSAAEVQGPALLPQAVALSPSGTISLQLTTVPGRIYLLQRSSGIQPDGTSEWWTIKRFQAGAAITSVDDPAPADPSKGFYRVIEEEAPVAPIAFSVTDHRRLIGIGADGQPRPGLLPGYDPATGRIGPLEFRPGGDAAAGDRRLSVRLAAGGRWAEDATGQAFIETDQAEIAFSPESPVQLARPLRLGAGQRPAGGAGGSTVRIPVGPLTVSTLEGLYQAADGTPAGNGVEVVVFRHFHLRLTRGQFEADRIRQAQVSWVDQAGRRPLPLPPQSGDYLDFDVSLEFRDNVLRLPFHGEFKLTDGTTSPAILRVPKSHPLMLELHADNHVSLNGRAEALFADGPSFQVDVSLDDPVYRLRFAARNVRAPAAMTVPDVLPVPTPGPSVDEPALDAQLVSLRTAFTAQRAFLGLLAADGALPESAACGAMVPIRVTPGSADGAAAFWTALVESGSLGSRAEELLPEELWRAVEVASSTAASSDDAGFALRSLAEIQRLRRTAAAARGQGRDRLAAALGEASAATVRILNDAPADLPLGDLSRILEAAVDLEGTAQAGDPESATEVIPALSRLIERVAPAYVARALKVEAGVSVAPPDSPITTMPRWEAFTHLRRLLHLECADEQLGGHLGLEAPPLRDAVGQLGRHLTAQVRAALLEALARQEHFRYRTVLGELNQLVTVGQRLGVTDGSFPTLAEWQAAANELDALGLANPDTDPRAFGTGTPEQLRDDARWLRELIPLEGAPPGSLAALHAKLGQRLLELFATAGSGPARPASEWLARIEAHLVHEELRLRSNLQPDEASLRFQLENAIELLIQQSGCGHGDAILEAARQVLDTAQRLDRVSVRDDFRCQIIPAPTAPVAAVVAARLALHRLASRLLGASKQAASILWEQSLAGRSLDPSLARADLVLPGGFTVEEAAGELSYDAGQRRLRGTLRGRLRAPQFNGSLTLANASFDSGGAFQMSAHGSAAFPRDNPALRIEVPARRPLSLALDLDRHLSLAGGMKARLRNGMEVEAWASLHDPVYTLGAAARGLQFEMVTNLTLGVSLLDHNKLSELPGDLARLAADYAGALGGAMEPLHGLVETPQFAPLGAPPEFEDTVVSFEFDSLRAGGNTLLLLLEKPAAFGYDTLAAARPKILSLIESLAKEADRLKGRLAQLDEKMRIALEVWQINTPSPEVEQATQEIENTIRQGLSAVVPALSKVKATQLINDGELSNLDQRVAAATADAERTLRRALTQSELAASPLAAERVRRAAFSLNQTLQQVNAGSESFIDAVNRFVRIKLVHDLARVGLGANGQPVESGEKLGRMTLDQIDKATVEISESSKWLADKDRQNFDLAPILTAARYLYVARREIYVGTLRQHLRDLPPDEPRWRDHILVLHGAPRVAKLLEVDGALGFEMNRATHRLTDLDTGQVRDTDLHDDVQDLSRLLGEASDRMRALQARVKANQASPAERAFFSRVEHSYKTEALASKSKGRKDRSWFLQMADSVRRLFQENVLPTSGRHLQRAVNFMVQQRVDAIEALLARSGIVPGSIQALTTFEECLAAAELIDAAAVEREVADTLLTAMRDHLFPTLRGQLILDPAQRKQAWWLAQRAMQIAAEGVSRRAEQDVSLVATILRREYQLLGAGSLELIAVLRDDIRSRPAQLDLRLPGDLVVREVWGQLTVDTRGPTVEGCIGGALEFPDLSGFRVAVPLLCVSTDGSFSLVGSVENLPAGEVGGQPVMFSGSLDVRGRGDPPVTFFGDELAVRPAWPGRIELTGSGSVRRGTGPGADTVSATLGYRRVRVGDTLQWRLTVSLAFAGVQRFGDDVVIFAASGGFDSGESDDRQAVSLQLGGKAGLWRKDRSQPLPADDGLLKPELFQLVVDNVQFQAIAPTDLLNGQHEVQINSGILRLPDRFYPRDLPEGLQCAPAPGTPRTGASVQILPGAPLILRVPLANGVPQTPQFTGALQFSHFGFSFAGLDEFGAAICQATLGFGADGPSLTIGEGRLDLPLPGQNLILALRNAQFNLRGLPVGEIALVEPFELLDLGGFRVAMLAEGRPPRFLPPGGTTPAERPGTRLTVINPDAPQDHGQRNLKFEGGLEVSFPASLLGAESAGTGGRDPAVPPSGEDTATVGASVAGYFEIKPRGRELPEVDLGLTSFSIGARNARWTLGPGGIAIADPSAQFLNLPALWKALGGTVNPNDAAKVILDGRIEVASQFNVVLRNARFIFDQPGGFPRFLVDSATYTEESNAVVRLLPVRLTKVGFAFDNPAAPLPHLLAPDNISAVFSARIQLPSGAAPLLEGELSNVKVTFNEHGLPSLPSLDGVELGLVGERLKIPPFDSISGKVRLGGLQGSDLNKVYMVGELMAKQQTTQIKVLGAFTWLGPLGICVDVSLGSSAIPIAYGFVFLGGQGGLSLIEGAGDPCQFSTYFRKDAAGRWVLKDNAVIELPVPSWQDFRGVIDRMVALAAQLPPPPLPGAPEPPRLPRPEGGGGGLAPAVDLCALPNTDGIGCADPTDCPSCPSRTINLLCQPHPDQVKHTNRVILKFSSIQDSVLRELGITEELFALAPGADPGALARDLAALVTQKVKDLTGSPALPPIAQALDAALLAAEESLARKMREIIEANRTAGAQGIYEAVRDRLYAGIPCTDITLSMAGRFSYTGLSTFAYIEGRMIQSSAGAAGLQGIVNVLGLPVGEGRLFVSYSDDQGLPNPSVCGAINVSLGPLDIGDVNATLRCDGCVTTVLGTFPRIARLVGEPLLRRVLQAAAPQLPSLEGLSVASMLEALARLSPDEQRSVQLQFFGALASVAPQDLPRDLPGEFVRLLGAQWDAIQPELIAWGQVGPRLFGFPLTPGGDNVAEFRFKTDKEGYSGGFEFAPSAFCFGFPPGDKARLTFDLRARDPYAILFGAMDGKLSSPERAKAFVEDQIHYALEHTTLGVSYQWHPFGLELADAAARILLPDLVTHPARQGRDAWRTPEEDGLPSRADVLIAAAAGGHLGNVLCWKGDNADFRNIFAEGDPRRETPGELDLRRRYFPHGGLVGGARMALPKMLSESPREWLTLVGDITSNPDFMVRLQSAAELIEQHLLATEVFGTAAFYVPAPNPPISDSFNLLPSALLDRIKKMDLSGPDLRDIYPGKYSFVQADMTNLTLLGLPVGTARLRGSFRPTAIQSPDPLATLTVAIEKESWIGRMAGRSFEMQANLYAVPPQAIRERFQALLDEIRPLLANGGGLADGGAAPQIQAGAALALADRVRQALLENLPKFAFTNTLPDLVVEHPGRLGLRAVTPPPFPPSAVGNPNLPPLFRIDAPTLYAFSPHFAPNTPGNDPIATAARQGGLGFSGQFILLPGWSGLEQPPTQAKLALFPDKDTGLPRLQGTLERLPLRFFPGLDFSGSHVAFDTGAAEFLTTETSVSGKLELPLGIFQVTPLSGGTLRARLKLAHTEARRLLNNALLPVTVSLQLSPALIGSEFIEGMGLRLHGRGGPDSEATLSTASWDARVSFQTSDGGGAGFAAAAAPPMTLRASLRGNSVAVVKVEGLPRSDLFSVEGSIDAFALRLDTGALGPLILSVFPELPLPPGFPRQIRIDPARGQVRLSIASDGTLEFFGKLGEPYRGGTGPTFPAGASVTINNRGMVISGEIGGSEGSIALRWIDGRIEAGVNLHLVLPALRSPLISLTAEDGGDFQVTAGTQAGLKLTKPRLTLHQPFFGPNDRSFTVPDLPLAGGTVPSFDQAMDPLFDELNLYAFPLKQLGNLRLRGSFAQRTLTLNFLADIRLAPVFAAAFGVEVGTGGLKVWLEPPDGTVRILGFPFEHVSFGLTNGTGELPSLRFSGELGVDLPWPGQRPRFSGFIPAAGRFNLEPLGGLLPNLGFPLQSLSQSFRHEPGAYADVVRVDGPSGYWRMEEDIPDRTMLEPYSAVLRDSSVQGGADGVYLPVVPNQLGADLPPVGRVPGGFDSANNAAVWFGGPGDHVLVALPADRPARFNQTDALTVELWFKRSSGAPLPSFSSEALGGHGNRWTITLTGVSSPSPGTRVVFSLGGLTDVQGALLPGLISRATIDDEDWHHLAGVFDGTAQSLYLDGRLDSWQAVRGSLSSDPGPITLAALQSRIAPFQGQMYGFFHGVLDEIAVYDRALSPVEIMDHEVAAGRGGLRFSAQLGALTGVTLPASANVGLDGFAGPDGSVALQMNGPAPATLGPFSLPGFSGTILRRPGDALLSFRAELPPPPGFGGTHLKLTGRLRTDGSFDLLARGDRLSLPQPFVPDSAQEFRLEQVMLTASRSQGGAVFNLVTGALAFPRFLGGGALNIQGSFAPFSLQAFTAKSFTLGPGQFSLDRFGLSAEEFAATGRFLAGAGDFAAGLLVNSAGIRFHASGDTGWPEACGEVCVSWWVPGYPSLEGWVPGHTHTECLEKCLSPPYMNLRWNLAVDAGPARVAATAGGRFQVRTGRGDGPVLLDVNPPPVVIHSDGLIRIDEAAGVFNYFLPRLW